MVKNALNRFMYVRVHTNGTLKLVRLDRVSADDFEHGQVIKPHFVET